MVLGWPGWCSSGLRRSCEKEFLEDEQTISAGLILNELATSAEVPLRIRRRAAGCFGMLDSRYRSIGGCPGVITERLAIDKWSYSFIVSGP